MGKIVIDPNIHPVSMNVNYMQLWVSDDRMYYLFCFLLSHQDQEIFQSFLCNHDRADYWKGAWWWYTLV